MKDAVKSLEDVKRIDATWKRTFGRWWAVKMLASLQKALKTIISFFSMGVEES